MKLYPNEIKERAKTLYCEHKNYNEVSRILNVNRDTIRTWISPSAIEKKRIAALRLYYKNRDCNLKKMETFRRDNKEYIKMKNSEYHVTNRDKIRERKRKYDRDNREKIYLRRKLHRQRNLNYRLTEMLRNRIRYALKTLNGVKMAHLEELLGCNIPECRKHLESQFKEGMSWENNTLKGWHIDHIIPCCKFDLSKLEDQKQCFHYTNLQPLWAKDNLSKGRKRPNQLVSKIEKLEKH